MQVTWKTCFKVGVSLFALYLAVHYWPNVAALLGALVSAAAPLLAGCVIAYLVNILMSFYERHLFSKSKRSKASKGRRPLCLILAFLTLVAVVVAVVALVLPQLAACIRMVIDELPGALAAGVEALRNWGVLTGDLATMLAEMDWQSRISQIVEVVASGIGGVTGVVVSAITSVVGVVGATVIGAIFSIYLLLDKDKLAAQGKTLMRRVLKPARYDAVMHKLAIFNDCFRRFIVGQCTEAVILGVLCMVGMLILQLPYAAMLGALVGFTALIPILGAWIGAIVGAFMIVLASPVQALVFVIFILVLQQVEGNLIYPRVVGSSVGLPAIWVFAAVMLGGGIAGILGMLLAVPVVAALYRILREKVAEEKDNLDEGSRESGGENEALGCPAPSVRGGR